MSTTVHRSETGDNDWDLITVKMQAEGDDRTLMYASHRGCGWVPPAPSEAKCSTCGAKLSDKMHRTVRVHNFVMKIGS